jgi:hypothetical protein
MANPERARGSERLDPEDLCRRLYQVLINQRSTARARRERTERPDRSDSSEQQNQATTAPTLAFDVDTSSRPYRHIPREAARQFSRTTTSKVKRGNRRARELQTPASDNKQAGELKRSPLSARKTEADGADEEICQSPKQSPELVGSQQRAPEDAEFTGTRHEPRVDWTQSDETVTESRPLLDPVLRRAQSLQTLKRRIISRVPL